MTFTAADELAAMMPRVTAAVAAVGSAATSRRVRVAPDIDVTEPLDLGPLDLDAAELLDAYRDGRVVVGEAIEQCLDRLGGPLGRRHDDGGLGAIAAIGGTRALADAEVSAARWRAGTARPLEGVPLVVKDLLDTEGLTTTGGSRWLAGRIPTADAQVVAMARGAGAIVVAKTVTYELGCGDEQTPFGRVGNPWDRDHITGGSSAGSATALSARMAPLALGTDTGGSVRIPSAFCGTVGLKPTLGRLPCAGLLGLAPTLDTPGPMARTAFDTALLFAALTGDRQPTAPGASLASRRIGVLGGWFTDVLADDVATAMGVAADVLIGLGAELVAVDIHDALHGAPLSWLITMSEAAVLYADAPRSALSAAFRRRLEVGDLVDEATYRDALRARAALASSVTGALFGFDAVIAPSCVSTAPPFDDVDRLVAGVFPTWPDVTARTMALWNVTGLPSLSVPIGFGVDGLPIGMQIVGAPFADETCLEIGATFQLATDHHTHRPASRISSVSSSKGTSS